MYNILATQFSVFPQHQPNKGNKGQKVEALSDPVETREDLAPSPPFISWPDVNKNTLASIVSGRVET